MAKAHQLNINFIIRKELEDGIYNAHDKTALRCCCVCVNVSLLRQLLFGFNSCSLFTLSYLYLYLIIHFHSPYVLQSVPLLITLSWRVSTLLQDPPPPLLLPLLPFLLLSKPLHLVFFCS